jgi:hypothetical protein
MIFSCTLIEMQADGRYGRHSSQGRQESVKGVSLISSGPGCDLFHSFAKPGFFVSFDASERWVAYTSNALTRFT